MVDVYVDANQPRDFARSRVAQMIGARLCDHASMFAASAVMSFVAERIGCQTTIDPFTTLPWQREIQNLNPR